MSSPDGNRGPASGPDPAALAVTMMNQLTDLLGAWEADALALAERGVDPRPLLAALARNLRAVADQLDGKSSEA